MVELDQSHDSHASDQGKMWRGGGQKERWRVAEVKTQNQMQRDSEEDEEEEK